MSQGRSTAIRPGRGDLAQTAGDAARKQAALEMIARYEPALKRTARRFSIDAEDADDAYQRALEIVLTKAPTTDARDLIRWTQTVTKHEALAVRRGREKLLGSRPPGDYGVAADPVAQIPAAGEGPAEQAERREMIARSREALRSLKPAELRALSLLAEGYSYAEIGGLTGFSRTKVNRVLAEGRNRFRSMLSSSEDGRRCRELRPLLSAFCDGEASPAEAETVREHLRACAHCRATTRTYRSAPRIAIALTPALPSRSLFERAHDLLAGLGSRLAGAGSGTDTAAQIAAAGGSRGAGMAALAKLLALCAGAGSAACVATGVVAVPLVDHGRAPSPPLERTAEKPEGETASEAIDHEPAPQPTPPSKAHLDPTASEETPNTTYEAPAGAVEYESPPSAPAPTTSSGGEGSASSGSAAGEFGP